MLRNDIKHCGTNAGEIPVVICMSLGSDKDLDHIYHVVVLGPAWRCSSSFCESIEGFFNPLLKYYLVCVSGSHPLISQFFHEGLNVTKLLLSECKFYDVLIDSFIDEEVSTDCWSKHPPSKMCLAVVLPG